MSWISFRTRKRRSADNRGVVTIEFAFVMVPLLYAMISIVEVAGLLVTQQALEQVTSQAAVAVARGAILSKSGTAAAGAIKSFICGKNLGLVSAANCNANLQVAVRDVTKSTSVPSSINPNGTLNTGAFIIQSVPEGDLMMIRAAVTMPQMSPFWNPVLNNMGDKRLLVATAVTNLHRYVHYNVEGSQ